MNPRWLELFPDALRANIKHNAPLAERTWFRVGGPAQALLRATDPDMLAEAISLLPADVPLQVLGAGSNVLIRDGGLPGLTVVMAGAFNAVYIDAATGQIDAGASVPCATLAKQAADAGIAGLEFLRGIPGTVGGAARMNAGCYGAETAGAAQSVSLIARTGYAESAYADLHPTYRHTDLPADTIITGVRWQGTPGHHPEQLHRALKALTDAREAAQPVREKTGGSTFKNPPGVHKAWQLIDAAGCRGMTVGGAQMSPHHCNFMINTGSATAHDLETLGETVRARVLEHSGVDLEWEIKRLGV